MACVSSDDSLQAIIVAQNEVIAHGLGRMNIFGQHSLLKQGFVGVG